MEVKLWTIILGAKTAVFPWSCVCSVSRYESVQRRWFGYDSVNCALGGANNYLSFRLIVKRHSIIKCDLQVDRRDCGFGEHLLFICSWTCGYRIEYQGVINQQCSSYHLGNFGWSRRVWFWVVLTESPALGIIFLMWSRRAFCQYPLCGWTYDSWHIHWLAQMIVLITFWNGLTGNSLVDRWDFGFGNRLPFRWIIKRDSEVYRRA